MTLAAAWGCGLAPAQPGTAAAEAFVAYTRAVEHRLAVQQAGGPFVVQPAAGSAELRGGGMVIEPVHEAGAANPLPGGSRAMLHHWRGTVFVPGGTAAGFQRLLRDLAAYPRVFAPEVLRASVVSGGGDEMQTALRVREHHVLTVTLDGTYDVTIRAADAHRGASVSRSLRLAEIAEPGTAAEHALGPSAEHGYLYRLNTYWSWDERDGGLYVQMETVSLSRAIPAGLRWALQPYVDSVPRDSLTFTLSAVQRALKR